MTAEKDAEAAWIEYRNGVQMRTPWEGHRRAMRRLRKRDFIAGYLAAARVLPPGRDPSTDHGVYFCDCTTDDHEGPHTYVIPPGTGDTDAAL